MFKRIAVPALFFIALAALFFQVSVLDSDLKSLRMQLYSVQDEVRTVHVQQNDVKANEESDRKRLNARDEADIERQLAVCKNYPRLTNCKALLAAVSPSAH